MNYYRKMLLLPVDEYNKYRSLLYTSQVTATKNPIQKDLNELRDEYGTNLPDDEKIKLEGEIIQKFKTKNTIDDGVKVSITPKHERIKELINDFSKTNKTRATQLYNHLSSKYKSRWNDDGELVDENGNTINDSNILDLINYVTSTQKSRNVPKGISPFFSLLRSANTPSYMFSKQGESNIEHIKMQESMDTDDDINISNEYTGLDNLFTQTPSKRGRKSNVPKQWIK